MNSFDGLDYMFMGFVLFVVFAFGFGVGASPVVIKNGQKIYLSNALDNLEDCTQQLTQLKVQKSCMPDRP